jgi:hypothetical protein
MPILITFVQLLRQRDIWLRRFSENAPRQHFQPLGRSVGMSETEFRGLLPICR